MPDAVLMKTCWNVTICSLGGTNIFILHKAKERNEAIQNAFKRISAPGLFLKLCQNFKLSYKDKNELCDF